MQKQNIEQYLNPAVGLAMMPCVDAQPIPKQGSSITYLDSPLIISSEIEEVVIVVRGEISKSVQRVSDFSTQWVMSRQG